jgi:hypothetical protein
MRWLTDDELVDAERRARAYQGAWTGTAGTIASYLLLAVRQIRDLQEARMGPPDIEQDDPAVHLLKTAIHTVSARRKTYGPPREHFARTVAAVNAIFAHKLREPLTEADWAQVMILDKLARHQGNGGTTKSSDTPIDLAGYAACLAECEGGSR